MLEKYQRAILGPTSSDSVASLGKEFGNTFSWVCMAFFLKKKKASQKKWDFDQNRITFTNILVILTTTTTKVFCIYTKANNTI